MYDEEMKYSDYEFGDEESVAKNSEVVETNLWGKLEKTKSKISFTKDIKALYYYMRDPDVPWYKKSLVVAGLIYFISPIDSIPDLLPVIGYLDDLGVIVALLKYLGSEIAPYYKGLD
jgi:uncharacterized membrane protein YkvA (DUF1232 family)